MSGAIHRYGARTFVTVDFGSSGEFATNFTSGSCCYSKLPADGLIELE